MSKEKQLPSVTEAAADLDLKTQKLDAARQSVKDAEVAYAKACKTFDAAVAEVRTICAR